MGDYYHILSLGQFITSEDLNGLGAGTYSVVVNDNNGC